MMAMTLATIMMVMGVPIEAAGVEQGVAWQPFVCRGGDFRLRLDCLMYGEATRNVTLCELALIEAERDFPGQEYSCMWITREQIDRPLRMKR
jgi:hypothetical protein